MKEVSLHIELSCLLVDRSGILTNCCIWKSDATEYGAPVARGIQLLTSSGQYTEGQVRQAIDALATEGHIYSTIDDSHYSFAM